MLRKFLPFVVMLPLYLMIGAIFYWTTETVFSNPLEIYSVHIEPIIYHGSKEVNHENKDGRILLHAGDTITVTSDTKRNASCILTVSRVLRKDKTDFSYFLNTSTRKIDPGPRITVRNQFRIPLEIEPGNYVLFGYVSVHCNPLNYLFPYERITTHLPITIVPSADENLKKPTDLGKADDIIQFVKSGQ